MPPAVNVVWLLVFVTVKLTLQLMGVVTVPVLLLGTASPMAAVVMVAELICGPGHAADETLTVAVTVTRLVEAAMG